MSVVYIFRCDRKIYDKVKYFYEAMGCDFKFAVFENPQEKNPHVHGLFYSNKSKSALDKSRQRIFKGEDSMKGQKAWMQSSCQNLDGYKTYMCKGILAEKSKTEFGKYKLDTKSDPIILHNLIMNDDEIKVRHEQFWTERAEGTTPVQRAKKMIWIDKTVKRFEAEFMVEPNAEEPTEDIDDQMEGKLDPLEVTKWICDHLSTHENKPWGPKLIQDVLRMFIWRYKKYFPYKHVKIAQTNTYHDILYGTLGNNYCTRKGLVPFAEYDISS